MALRICTGAYRTSPVESLYVDSGIPPLSIHREELGLRYLSRVLTSKLNPNYKYVKQPTDRAPTRPRLPKPLEVRLMDSANQISLLPPAVAEIRPPKYPPWVTPNIRICAAGYDKKTCSDEQLKSSILEHASEHANSISIYTDGSKSPAGVGCSVVAPDSVIKKKLPANSTVFTAELLAVLTALKYIFFSNQSSISFTIFTDSMSILASLRKFSPSHQLVQEILDWFYLLVYRKGMEILFCWVPAHVGIIGNERADSAAKAATRLSHVSNMSIPVCDFNPLTIR